MCAAFAACARRPGLMSYLDQPSEVTIVANAPGDFETDFAPYFEPPLAPVERIDVADGTRFLREFRDRDVPVVLRNATASWPAHARWRAPDYLKQTVGAVPAYVRDLETSDVSGASYREPYRCLPFDAFVDLITAPSAAHLYLTQGIIRRPHGPLSALERDVYPALLHALAADVGEPPFWSLSDVLQTNLWMGPGGHASALHYDEFDNLNAAISGEKRWLLFPSGEVEKLTADRPDALYTIAHGFHADEPNRFEPRVRRTVRGYQCVTKPGEMLYVPAGMWHQVFSGPGLSIAVNFWFLRLPHDLMRVGITRARRYVGFRSRRHLAVALARTYVELGKRLGRYAVQRALNKPPLVVRVGATSY